MIPALFKHQSESISFLENNPQALDFSDPGTGKTRVEIEDFQYRRKRGGGCALVIAPKSLLRSAWQDDFHKFAPWIRTSVAYASNREKAFERDADVYITNTDATPWLKKKPAAFFKKFDTLIVDEITAFKHHTSARSKALSTIVKHFKYRRGLTGTPTANGITDLWHQVYLIDDGKRLGRSFFAFRNATCTAEQVGPMPNMLKWSPKPGIENVVAKLIEDITLRHVFEDCIDIPANHMYTVAYHLPVQQMLNYNNMEQTFVLRLATHIVADKMGVRAPAITAVNAAVLGQKLLQISSGAVYDEVGLYHLTDGDRYSMIADMIEARERCVVFYLWKHQRDELVDEFESRGITHALIDADVTDNDRHMAVKNFQNGLYKVILAHPQSAAHGLTLTKGTSTIWCSPTYNLEHFLQGNRRIYRAGQTQKTETIVVVAPGTLEEKVYNVLTTKGAHQRDLLKLVGNLVDEESEDEVRARQQA